MTEGEWLWTTACTSGRILRIDRLALAVELHNVGRLDEARRHAARQEEMLGLLVVAHADMAKPIDNALVVEDAVGRDEILDQRRVGWLCRIHLGPGADLNGAEWRPPDRIVEQSRSG